MLLSPGNSPRNLSSPSPSPSVSERALTTPSTQLSSSVRHSRNKNTVLDEDAYVASIEKIIERDFFPDIPKLRDRLDWLEAIKTHDPVLIKDAQLKILERRRGKVSGGETGTGRVTPGTNLTSMLSTPMDLKTPSFSQHGGDGVLNVGGSGSANTDDSVEDSDTLSLDAFFRRYTSEDNDSFSKILGKVNRKRKEKFGYLYDAEKEDVKALKLDERDRITDGYGTSDQPVSTLESWKYTAKNLLMYNPVDGGELALTEDERDERLKNLTKEISQTNTRFHGKLLDSMPKEEDTIGFLYNPVAGGTPMPIPFSGREAEKLKKYDLEDMRKTPNQFYVESAKKSENGYNYVKTPSPAPGVDESPFITWGEIEGTPLRLETEDTPVGIGGDGAHFRIPCPPTRDVKAHSMSREAARKIRERTKMFQKPPLPSPSRGGSASPSVKTLSSAAQKFVRNAIAKSSNSVDETLRASYRGSSPSARSPKVGNSSLTRFGKEGSVGSRSPSIRDASNPPW